MVSSVLFSSESEEHYTPPWLLDMVVEVLGQIDLDPCSDPYRSVPATRHYTVEDNGLTLPWRGRVFMNPPYGPAIKHWTQKLIREIDKGWCTQAIALLPSRTDTIWFRPMYQHHVCFLYGRITFLDHNYQEQDAAPFPSAVVYLGGNADKFAQVFRKIGHVYLSRYHVIPQQEIPYD